MPKPPPHVSKGELTPNESAFLRRLVDLAVDQLLKERAAAPALDAHPTSHHEEEP